MPDHFSALQAGLVLLYAFFAGFTWTIGSWLATKVHK